VYAHHDARKMHLARELVVHPGLDHFVSTQGRHLWMKEIVVLEFAIGRKRNYGIVCHLTKGWRRNVRETTTK
jgi:hypothetical protein